MDPEHKLVLLTQIAQGIGGEVVDEGGDYSVRIVDGRTVARLRLTLEYVKPVEEGLYGPKPPVL